MSDVAAIYKVLFEFIVFFRDFQTYIIKNHPCLKCCIFPKLSQIVCLINTNIFVYYLIPMSNVSADYEKLFEF